MKFEDSWENNTHQDVEDAIKDKVEEIEGRIDDVEDSVPDAGTIEEIRQAAQDAQDAAAAVGDIINENSGRVSHGKAPAVVLRYIHQNGTDDMSLDDLNAGDVYADAGGSLELIVIENGSKTVKNIGTIDKGLIFYSIREEGFFRYLGSAAWELLSQGGGEEQEGTFAELDVDSRLKHIQSPVMALDCISQSEEPGIADCPIGGYYCYMGNQASACRIRYRKAKVTAGQYEDIDLSSPQGHVLYYNKPEDKTYRWDGQRLVAVLWHAGLAIDNRLMSSRATAVVLWYISANLDDGETTMGANSGDVYCDSNNHIIVRGGTVNPDKEYVTAASLPTTPDADLGLPDQKLVYYDVNKKDFYRWNGSEWKKALNIDIDTTNLVTITKLNNALSSYATKSELSGKQDTIQDLSTIRTNASKGAAAVQGIIVEGNELQKDTNGKVTIPTVTDGEDGITPHIDTTSGNWMLGTTDTNVHAQGPKGDKGDRGDLNITEGTTPTLTIVSDLNTEDDEVDNIKVLSAGMGKRIGDELYTDREAVLDFANTELTMVYINSGKFYTSTKYGGKFFNIARYKGWTLKIGNYKLTSGTNAGNWFYRFALLKNGAHASNTAPAYSDVSPYNDLVSVNSASDDDQWTELTIPDDVNFIYIYTHNSDTNPDDDFDPDVVLTNPNAQSRIDLLESSMESVSGELHKDKITELSLENTELAGVYIKGTEWKTDTSYQGKIIDISQYQGLPFKIGNYKLTSGTNAGNWFYRFAFLTSDSHTGGQSVQFSALSPYTGQISVVSAEDTAQWHEGVVPSDATHMYVYCYNGTSDTLTHYFPPEIIVIEPKSISRIGEIEEKISDLGEELESVNEAIEGISDEWFAAVDQDRYYPVPMWNCWVQQTIAKNGTVYTGDINATGQICFPKSASISAVAATAADCWLISDLPADKKLRLKFADVGTDKWNAAVALYTENLSFIERIGYETTTAADGWEIVFDLSSKNTAYFFKVIVSRSNSSDTVYNANDYAGSLEDGTLSWLKAHYNQPSMPDRVAALEAGAGASSTTLRVLQYNIGHFAMGKASSTSISDQIPDGDATTPNSNYDVQLKRWKSKIQNIGADVMCLEEYSTAFGTKNGASVNTADCGIFDGYGHISYGTTNTAYWVNALVSKLPLLSAAKVDLGSTASYKAFMQVATINVGGTQVKVASTHLNWSSDAAHEASREVEMKNIIKYFQNDDHVIVCGDFNTDAGWPANGEQFSDIDFKEGAAEFDLFLYGFTESGTTYDGGYTAANHGLLGDLFTFAATGSRPDQTSRPQIPYCCLDNVLTKGFKMSNIIIIDDGHLTDHCGIMCDLTVL